MADSLQETERQRREFIANVSHELKTPMTTIAGYTDGILDGTIPPEQEKEYLRIISDEARRLSRLVRRMLEVSQLQSRDLTRTKAPFDVCESMRRVLISMEKKITDRGLDVDADIPDSGIMVLGDNDLITQVIYNLLENCGKIRPQGLCALPRRDDAQRQGADLGSQRGRTPSPPRRSRCCSSASTRATNPAPRIRTAWASGSTWSKPFWTSTRSTSPSQAKTA